MDAVSLVKSKLNIVDVIGEYVTLKKAGTSYKGLCPFHNEKSPSFNVSFERQMYHCFGCSKGGDVISFVQDVENIDFIKALELLAMKAGVELEQYQFKKKNSQSDGYDALKLASSFYIAVLNKTAQGKEALAYCKERGITEATLEEWGIGYSPDGWDGLYQALRKKGFNDKILADAGLCLKSQKGTYFDRFRSRVMIPLRDITGRVVGFTGRILPSKDDKKSGKYVNSPQSDYYNKSEILFGIDKAKKKIREDGFAILVEGNMDVLLSHQVGVTNTIAASGTALTEQQLKLLQRLTERLYFCFDQDEAGILASMRGIELALKMGFSVYVIILKSDDKKTFKDPADVISHKPELWKEYVNKAVPMMEYLLNYILSKYNVATGEGKKNASKDFRHYASLITDPAEKSHWFTQGAQRLDISEEVLRAGMNFTQQRSEVVRNDITKIERQEAVALHLFALIFKFPKILEDLDLSRMQTLIHTTILQQLAQKLFLYYNNNRQLNLSHFFESLRDSSDIYSQVAEITLLIDKEFTTTTYEEATLEASKLMRELTQQFHKTMLQKLSAQLKNAEVNSEHEKIAQLMQDISLHQQALSSL